MKKHTIFFSAGVLAACAACFTLPKLVPEFPSLFVSAANQEISENLTLQSDMVVDGDLILTGGTLNLNGHSLTVKGDLWHKAGILSLVHGSTLHITGDYQMRSSLNSSGTGELQMEYEAEGEQNLLDVDGSVNINTYHNASNWQNAGTLRIGGNLNVWTPVSDGKSGRGLAMRENTLVTFKGDAVHEVWFDSSAVSYISNVSMTGSGSIHLTGQTTGFKLASDLTLADESVIRGERNLVLNGYTLTTNGTFTQDGPLNVTLNGSKMNVNGDYWHKNGILEIENGSTLHITGDYQMRSSLNSSGTGELQMEYEAEGEQNLLDVDGSVNINTYHNASNWQNAGTLRIGGNLNVWTPVLDDKSGRGLAMQENTLVTFKGDDVHEVWFDSSAVSYISNIAMSGKGSLHLTGQTTGFKLASDVRLADESVITGSRALDLNGHTLWVNGTFTQNGNLTVSLKNSKMVVKTDYWHKNGILSLNNSTLTIGGNYEMRSSLNSSGTGELRMEGTDATLMEVNGDANFNTYFTSANWQNKGTLLVGGNLYVARPVSDGKGGIGLAMQETAITAFRGGKKHIVHFSGTDQHTGAIKLGIGDSIEFASNLNGVGRTADSQIIVEPAGLATVSTGVNQFVVTGAKTGEGKITFKDGKSTVTKTLYVVAAEGIPTVVIPDSAIDPNPNEPPVVTGTVTTATDPGTSPTTTTTTTTTTVTGIRIRSAFERIPSIPNDGGQNTSTTPKADGPCFTIYKNVDFDTGARSVRMEAAASGERYFEIRLDSPDGTLIGTVNVPATYKPTDEKKVFQFFDADVTLTEGIHDVYLIWCPHPADSVLSLRGFVFGREDTSAGPPVGSKKGDVNEDGSVDLKDVTILRRYLAGGWNVTINEYNSDVNGDGSIDLKDVTILRRYLAGGWGIEL